MYIFAGAPHAPAGKPNGKDPGNANSSDNDGINDSNKLHSAFFIALRRKVS